MKSYEKRGWTSRTDETLDALQGSEEPEKFSVVTNCNKGRMLRKLSRTVGRSEERKGS